MPFALGTLPVRFMRRENRTISMVWVSGWVVAFALFQLVAVPMIIKGMRFTFLTMVYTGVVTGLSAVCLLTGIPVLKEGIKGLSKSRLDMPHMKVMLPVIILVALQLAAMVLIAYPDGDDAYYIGTSVTTLHTDSMYIFDPYNGSSSPLDVRHALSPVPIFMAWLSGVTGFNPTVLCHVYMGCILLLLMYTVYYKVGARLFPDQKTNNWAFLLFVNILYLFGNISIYTPESFAFTRTWQGKSMFANIVVPLIFFFLPAIARNAMDTGEWMLLFLLSIMGVFTTSTAVFTLPLIVGISCLVFFLRDGNPKLPLMMLPCVLPCAAYGMLYLLMR